MALATAAESCAGVIAGAGIAGAGIAGAAASVVIWTKVASDSAPGRAIVAASRSSLSSHQSMIRLLSALARSISHLALPLCVTRLSQSVRRTARGATGRQAARRCGRARDNKAVTSSPFEAT